MESRYSRRRRAFSPSQGATEAEALDNIRDAKQEDLGAVAGSLQESNMRGVEVSV